MRGAARRRSAALLHRQLEFLQPLLLNEEDYRKGHADRSDKHLEAKLRTDHDEHDQRCADPCRERGQVLEDPMFQADHTYLFPHQLVNRPLQLHVAAHERSRRQIVHHQIWLHPPPLDQHIPVEVEHPLLRRSRDPAIQQVIR